MLPSLLLGRRKRRAVGNDGGAIESSAQASSSLSSSSAAAAAPPSPKCPTSLHDLCVALRRQQVVELRLGWHDDNMKTCVGLDCTRRRQVRRLTRAIECCSSLQRIQIGSGIRSRVVVTQILSALAASPCLSIRSFQLILDPAVQWIPEDPLKDLLLRQIRLEKIELRGVQGVAALKALGPGKATLPPTKECKSMSTQYWGDRSVISRIIVRLHRLERLASLELVDCNATDEQANQLADFLHVRGGVRLSRLSVRLNRRLTWTGLRVLCQAPVMDQLDFSLCDLHSLEAVVVAASIAKRPWPLRELVVCGNSHIGTSGWVALTSPECCNKLTVINLSHCVSSCTQAAAIFDSLGRSLGPDSTLREVTMQGCCRQALEEGRDSIFAESLCRLLKQTSSLRAVRLGSSGSCATSKLKCSRAWSPKDLSRVLDALRANYEMELLLYDSWRCDWAAEESSAADLDEICSGVDFVLRLNQAGRRHLLDRHDRHPTVRDRQLAMAERSKRMGDDEWLHLLEKAGKDDLDVLYWVVRESADRFGADS